MKTITLINAIIFTLILSACSSNDYAHQSREKKPLTNDRALLISLLKRPTTADQIMMEQFAAVQYTDAQNALYSSPQVGYVAIKGAKPSTSTELNTSNNWIFTQTDVQGNLLYNTNFVRLAGPN